MGTTLAVGLSMKRNVLGLTILVAAAKLACVGSGADSVPTGAGADGGDPNGTGVGTGGPGSGPTCAARASGWNAMANDHAPTDVSNFETTTVMSAWTGRSLLIVYHGPAATFEDGANTGDLHGKSFDPESNTWTELDVSSLPTDASWMHLLDDKVLVWGKRSGALFDAVAATWTTRALPDAPGANTGSFVGSKLVQISHASTDSYDHFESTRIYDFENAAWTTVSPAGAPTPRYAAAQVVAGDRFVVWGGYTGQPSPTNPAASVHPMNQDGAILDVSAGTWTTIAAAGAPAARHSVDVARYAGNRVVLWGGQSIDLATDKTTLLADGALLDPIANAWSPMVTRDVPSARWNTLQVVVGAKVVVYGGQSVWPAGAHPFLADGATYDVATNTWTAMPASPAPILLEAPPPPAVTWRWRQAYEAGSRAIFLNPKLDVVEAFDPVGNVWQSVPVPGNMAGRSSYLAAWTGCRLVVFGGQVVDDSTNPCALPHTTPCDPPAPPTTPFHDGATLNL
jgi:hypothetical protein